MKKDKDGSKVVQLPRNERPVSLDNADRIVLNAVTRRALLDGLNLQDVLKEAFEGRTDIEFENLIRNGGILDAIRKGARKKAKGE